jgi:hypothetical protein
MTRSNKRSHQTQKHTSSEEEDGAYIQNPPSPPDTHEESLSDEEEVRSEDYDTEMEYGTPIRSRIRFTTQQTELLEDMYQRNQRPSTEEKAKLAARFDTPVSRIQIWFQNRRATEKKTRQSSKSADGGPSASRTSSSRSSRNRDTDRHLDSQSSRQGPSQRAKKRRPEEKLDDQVPIQLRSSQGRHCQFPIPPPNVFYHTSARSADMIPYYPTTRHSDPGILYNPYHPFEAKLYYATTTASPTINPQEMIYPAPADYIPPDSYNTPSSSEHQLSIEEEKYIMSDNNFTLLAEGSTSSSLRQQQEQAREPGQSSTNILSHDDEQQLPAYDPPAAEKGELML